MSRKLFDAKKKQASKFEPKIEKELVKDRTSDSQTFETQGGGEMVRLSPVPEFYKPEGSSAFVPVDTDISPVSGRPGVWAAKGNAWTTTVSSSGPDEGLKLALPGAQVSIRPVGGAASGLAQAHGAANRNSVEQQSLWPHVGGQYTVGPESVSEDLVLRSASAATSFEFTITGATLVADPSTDGAELTSGGQVVAEVPAPLVSDRSGSVRGADPVLSVTTAGMGQILQVAIDPSWLRHLPASAFPVTIDPEYDDLEPSSTDAAFSVYTVSSANPSSPIDGTVKVGTDQNGVTWRAALHFNYEQWLDQNPQYQVTTAALDLTDASDSDCWDAQTDTDTCSTPVTDFPINADAIQDFSELLPSGDVAASSCGGSTTSAIDSECDYAQTGFSPFLSLGTNFNSSAPGMNAWFNDNTPSMGVSLIGHEGQDNTMKDYSFYDGPDLNLDIEQPPSPVTVTTPANGSVIPTTTPTLSAPCVSSPDGTVEYDFRIGTSTTGSGSSETVNGTVVDSGNVGALLNCSAPVAYNVPPGSLEDGTTYYVQVTTSQLPGVVVPQPSGVTQFRVNLRLGGGGPSPTDTVGSLPGGSQSPSAGSPSPQTPPGSVMVNMVNGNLSFSQGNHSLTTDAAPLSVGLTYNSLAQDSAGSVQPGLIGQYYSDTGNHEIVSSNLVGQRTDDSIDFAGSPISALNSGPYVAQWNGYVNVPTAHTNTGCSNEGSGDCWGVVIAASGGMEVSINGTQVASTWTNPNSWAGGYIPLTGGEHTISIEAWEPSDTPEIAAISMQDTSVSGSAPDLGLPGLLSSTPQTLPSGWTLSTGAGTLQFTSLRDGGTTVDVTQSDGSSLAFAANGNGGFTPSPGTQDLLTSVTGGYDLSTPDNQLYFFDPNGQLASVTSSTDDLNPADPTYTYEPIASDPAPVLTSITDSVSERSIDLIYTGESNPPVSCPTPPSGYDSAPNGMVCAISYWDGTQTNFFYDSYGRLAEVVNPGSETSQFGYDPTSGLLSQIRDPLAYDAVAASVAPDTTASETSVAYSMGASGDYQVASVTSPQPSSGQAQPERTYSYYPNAGSCSTGGTGTTPAGGYTMMNIAGFTPAIGYAEEVVYSQQDEVCSESKPTGASTTETNTTIWNNDQEPVVSINAAGEQTTSVYNLDDLVTQTYGPAPTACFTTTSPYTPVANSQNVAGCDESVAETQESYDGGITSLAATFWSNPYTAGKAELNATGTYDNTSSDFVDEGADFPPSVMAGSWSAQYSGTVDLSTTGTYTFEIDTHQSASIYVNDQLVATAAGTGSGGNGSYVQGTVSVTSTNEGTNRIRIDYVGSGSSTSKNGLDLKWEPPGVKTFKNIPLSDLDPSYGLLTMKTDPDGDVTTTSYSDSGDQIDPEYGLATDVTQYPNGTGEPSSQDLTTTTTYETPGGTGSFIRKIATTLPAGDPTPGSPADGATADQTTYSYYAWNGDPAITTNQCGITPTTDQGGLESAKVEPASATGQSPIETQYLYNLAGQIVGTRTGTESEISGLSWNCTTYDSRGRVTQQTYGAHNGAPAQTISYSYSFYGSPLATYVTEGSNNVLTLVDLLGRVTNYDDAAAVADSGSGTTTTYDQAGQTTSVDGPQGDITDTYYPNSGFLDTVALNGTTEATASYSSSNGELTGVTYANQTSASIGYDQTGQENSLVFSGPSGDVAADEVTRDAAGRITTEETDTASGLENLNPNGGADYRYDEAGRLIESYGVGHSISYSYGANSASCTDPNQAMDTNISSETTTPYSGGSAVTQNYCYNQSDQLTSESSTTGGINSTSFSYDDEGNTTQLNQTSIGWNSSGQDTSLSASGQPTTTYTLDPVERMYTRTEGSSAVTFAFCGYTSTACATVNSSYTAIQGFVSLPGGALLTTQSGGNVWSYANIAGDMIATANSSGSLTGGPFTYNPFGAQDPSGTGIQNGSENANFGAFGQPGLVTDTGAATGGSAIIQMGARPYMPSLGRFLASDPVQGGCANAYSYVFGDPIDSSDFSGDSTCFPVIQGPDLEMGSVSGGGSVCGYSIVSVQRSGSRELVTVGVSGESLTVASYDCFTNLYNGLTSVGPPVVAPGRIAVSGEGPYGAGVYQWRASSSNGTPAVDINTDQNPNVTIHFMPVQTSNVPCDGTENV